MARNSGNNKGNGQEKTAPTTEKPQRIRLLISGTSKGVHFKDADTNILINGEYDRPQVLRAGSFAQELSAVIVEVDNKNAAIITPNNETKTWRIGILDGKGNEKDSVEVKFTEIKARRGKKGIGTGIHKGRNMEIAVTETLKHVAPGLKETSRRGTGKSSAAKEVVVMREYLRTRLHMSDQDIDAEIAKIISARNETVEPESVEEEAEE